VDDSEIHDGVIDFSKGVNQATLRITISLDAATLEGRVVGDDGKPTPFLPRIPWNSARQL
jgi:hypothetical protein